MGPREEPSGPFVGHPAVAAASEGAGHQHVVQDRELGEEPDELERAGDPAPADAAGRPPGDGLALEPDLAAGRADAPRDGVEEGGLPGAVGTDEADDLPA